MFIVKLIVTTLCFLITKMCCINYCDICINHTLCKFNGTTPGPSCEGYNISVNLTKDDINNIVQKINERRHFVASGLTKNYRLPQAANMRKIVWSNELSKSAQRWADQCDINQHPDKEDECRNLENEKVGQCIASITGVTRGLNVRSFIDYWFMKSLTYIGSISFYNHSTDYNNRQFTQLIWANTHSVGCGRVKFYINNGRVLIDRLVCNFAPTGNINEETVYAIGFPATQCPKDTVPDFTYTSLCTLANPKEITTYISTRNNIIKENISTIDDKYLKEILKLKEIIKNETGGKRRQKIRHIWRNESPEKNDYLLDYEVTTRPPSIKHPMLFNKKIYHYTIKPMSTTMYKQPSPLRSFNFNKCTRRAWKSPKYQIIAGCTRRVKPQINNEYFPVSTTTETINTNPISTFPTRHFQCTRGRKTTPTICSCDLPTKCQCTLTEINPTSVCQGTPCNNILRDDKKAFFKKIKIPSSSHYDISDSNNNIRNNFKPMLIDTPRRNYRNLRKNPFPPQRKYPKRLYQNKRKRRQYDKPFWKEDIIGNKKALKGVRYTTLSRRKNRRPVTTSKHPSIHNTEAITLKVTSEIKYGNKGRPNNRGRDKYLSFDELMTLRRSNQLAQGAANPLTDTTGINEVNQANSISEPEAATEATTAATTAITITLKKLLQCTRKMTCTWTALGDDKNKRPGGGAGAGGADGDGGGFGVAMKTRYGYVEGCSRTSTCTRDYMERNKLPNSGGSGGAGADGANGGKDEDYCEKRSLKVQRRNSENNHDYKLDSYDDEQSRTTPIIKEHNEDYKCTCT